MKLRHGDHALVDCEHGRNSGADYNGRHLHLGSFIAIPVMLVLLGCQGGPKPTATASQIQYCLKTSITRKTNGTTVERIGLRHPILTQHGIIDVAFRIRNVPEAPRVIFYVPCYADGGCAPQPIPGEPREVVPQDGDVITVSNTTDATRIKRWTPPPGAVSN